MIRFLIIPLLVSIFLSGNGQNKWDSSLIADSLKTDANAVIRFYSTDYERLSVGSYLMKIHQVVTVLNEKGIPASELLVPYDRNSKVVSIEGIIYDKEGASVKPIKKKDFDDFAYNNDFTLFSDDRVKHYIPPVSNFPYTVEYLYTVEANSLIGFGTWYPQWFDISAEKAQLTFLTPPEFGLRHKELNYSFKTEIREVDKKKQYRWVAENLTAIRRESSAPDYLDIFPALLLAPNEISFEKYTGDFSSWNSYGQWVYQLIENRDVLTPAAIEEIKSLTDPIPNKKDKVKALYQYMQRKTRYVNIALGIGGLQPVPAADVHEKGFGDCKALSNYMKALLKSIGINAYYTVIGHGPHQKIKFPEFPSQNQSNHIILCVPTDQDTTWLECTSQTIPFGYIGSGNSDRYALVITPTGGVLTRTPVYAAGTNTRTSSIRATLMDDGSATFLSDFEFRNYLYEEVFHLMGKSKEEQKKSLLRSLPVNGLEINDFSLTDISDRAAKASLEVKGQVKSFSIKAGNRLFVQPDFLYENSFPATISANREQDLCENPGYCYKDTITLSWPDHFRIDFSPQNKLLTSTYGAYQLVYNKVQENMIIITRSVQINKGIYDKSLFKEINAFLANIAKCEKEKIVLVPKG